jgi:hypothetical protein
MRRSRCAERTLSADLRAHSVVAQLKPAMRPADARSDQRFGRGPRTHTVATHCPRPCTSLRCADLTPLTRKLR